MMRSSTIATIRAAACAAALALLVWAMPAHAAAPVFPVGSPLGLVPPPGMSLSPNFMGFEDRAKHAAILLTTFPADAFAQLDKSLVPEALQKQSIAIDKREPFQTGAGKGFLLSGRQSTDKGRIRKFMLVAPAGNMTALVSFQITDQDNTYSDQVVRDTLATLVVRARVPDAERLSLLPFTVGDLAGFRIDDVLPGRALMLVDGPAGNPPPDKTSNDGNIDIAGRPVDARFLVAALEGGPTEPSDDDDFARVTFDQIGGIKNVRVQDAEPLRIGGQAGYETLANAKDPRSNDDLRVVQWLRFGTGGYMQMVGIARAEVWPGVFPRLRKVRDSIDPK